MQNVRNQRSSLKAKQNAQLAIQPNQRLANSLSPQVLRFQARSSQSASKPARSIVFIDRSIKNYRFLAAEVRPKFRTFKLNSFREGIEQVTRRLEKFSRRNQIESVHIVSNGSPGAFQLGSQWVDNNTLSGSRGQFKRWQQFLSKDADVFLYGSRIAENGLGKRLVRRISRFTKADVAASTDVTGNKEFRGDWQLEFKRGKIQARKETELFPAFQESTLRTYGGTLSIRDPFISTAAFVVGGTKVDATEVGENWIQGNGYLEQIGTDKYLYAGKAIAAGDFSISATLSLGTLNGSAASFEIDGDRFGFDGGRNRFFTEGDDWGSPQFHGTASRLIKPGQPFELQVTRRGTQLSFAIDGTVVTTRTLTSGRLTDIGFRPWRNTMQLFNFAIGNTDVSNLTPNPFFADQPIFVRGTDGYAAYRIPAVVQAGNGDLLAFAEGRVNGTSDFGNIDIVMRRSTDNGQTWQPLTIVADNGNLTAGNPSVVVDRLNNNRLVMVYNTGTHSEQDTVNGLGAREAWVTTSDDNGLSWSKPSNITTSVHRPNAPEVNPAYTFADDWRWHAVLPGHGIQLNNGRLVFGANYKLGDDRSNAFSFYSDDGGQTWQLGGVAGYPGNENQIVQLPNGNLMMNARRSEYFNDPYRQVSISTDNGKSWSPFVSDKNLPDPRVEASILGWQPDGTYRLLFSNPASQTSRTNMTVRISYDEGKSWAYSRNVRPNLHGAYSDLVIQSDNKIGLLYETGDNADGNANDLDYISYARFNLGWLTQGNDLFA